MKKKEWENWKKRGRKKENRIKKKKEGEEGLKNGKGETENF